MVHPLARRDRCWLLGSLAGFLISAVAGTGQAETKVATTPQPAALSPRDLHVWGHFGSGTWKQVRIVTESLGDRGDVIDTTTTDTKTTLVRADLRHVTLRIEATVDVAGKRFQSQPQIVEYGYFG